uniref:Uncharacterized protein n=1 Tax=Knipowitschia caucasica TaxID=637954 RepID=A0AAV2J5U9_KNICA
MTVAQDQGLGTIVGDLRALRVSSERRWAMVRSGGFGFCSRDCWLCSVRFWVQSARRVPQLCPVCALEAVEAPKAL